MASNEIEHLKAQLKVSRDEIANLRTQVGALTYLHKKDVESIRRCLKDFKCENCQSEKSVQVIVAETSDSKFKPIGLIKTMFADKRAVPRQAVVAEKILSKLELNADVFTNPEHSLEGLEEFTHIWIIYHFHLNESHTKAKVAPPRLDGAKTGVFSTRSPHRPCPIGISLVKLDHIEGSTIYFYGTDMVSGTPVLDIKPFIPQYDNPSNLDINNCTISNTLLTTPSREEPDGEETDNDNPSGMTTSMNSSTVKIPNWIAEKKELFVIFSDNAIVQLEELGINQDSISETLKSDPRNVYVREKYLSQIYTFQLGENNVICKFDDKNATVTVLQIKKRIVNLQN
ncbi:unnamed protein product [Diamesa hyperborea]